MDYIKEAENYLIYYGNLKESLKHANRVIGRLKWLTAPKDLHGVAGDESGVSADKPVNTLQQLYELSRWQEQKKHTEEEILNIENALNEISKVKDCESYRKILELWYVDKRDKYEISAKLNYSKRNLYRLKEDAIKRFAVTLFGIDALRAI